MDNSFYIQPYLDTLSKFNNNADFVRCDSSDGTHICYKLKDDLYDPERYVRYEFLFEFDMVNYGYGIYYGCKCVFLNGDDEVLRQKVDQEWSQLRKGLTDILNNTFPGMDFLRRALMMEQPINRHYWPFWIKLVEDESICEIANKVLRGIHFVYQTRLVSLANWSFPNQSTSDQPFSEMIRQMPEQNEHSFPKGMSDEEKMRIFREVNKKMKSEMSNSESESETKKPGVNPNTSIIKEFIFIEDSDNSNSRIRQNLNQGNVIMECQQLIAGTTDSARLRCLFQLLCETEDSTCKILRGENQFTKFCREIVGIKDEHEAKKTAERIRKNKTWTKHIKEYKPKIDEMVKNRLIFLP